MLRQDLNVLLSSTFGFAVKAQRYHWNVMGPHFYSHHEFYQELYEELYEHVDIIAEAIRSLGSFPVGSLDEFSDLSQISEDDDPVTDPGAQMSNLAKDNDVLIRIIKIALKEANSIGAEDIADLLVNRLRAHKKHGWMLNSHINRQQRQV